MSSPVAWSLIVAIIDCFASSLLCGVSLRQNARFAFWLAHPLPPPEVVVREKHTVTRKEKAYIIQKTSETQNGAFIPLIICCF